MHWDNEPNTWNLEREFLIEARDMDLGILISSHPKNAMKVLLNDSEDFRTWLENGKHIHVRILHYAHGPRPKLRPFRKIGTKVRSPQEHNTLNTLSNLSNMLFRASSGEVERSLCHEATEAVNNEEDLPIFGMRSLAKTSQSPEHILGMIANPGLGHWTPETENVGVVDELQNPRIGKALGEQVAGPVGVALFVEPCGT
jgi:hypothetical protein